MELVFLPGLDGSGKLFDPILSQLSSSYACRPLAYPADVGSYAGATSFVQTQIRQASWLVAELFSGPVAWEVAQNESSIQGVILIASFISNPMTRAQRFVSTHLAHALTSISPPKALLKFSLLGGEDELLPTLVSAIAKLPANTMADRLQAIAELPDVASPISQPAFHIHAGDDRLLRSRREAVIEEHVAVAGPHLLLQTRAEECAAKIVMFVELMRNR